VKDLDKSDHSLSSQLSAFSSQLMLWLKAER
jgi:hypothetical protein